MSEGVSMNYTTFEKVHLFVCLFLYKLSVHSGVTISHLTGHSYSSRRKCKIYLQQECYSRHINPIRYFHINHLHPL